MHVPPPPSSKPPSPRFPTRAAAIASLLRNDQALAVADPEVWAARIRRIAEEQGAPYVAALKAEIGRAA